MSLPTEQNEPNIDESIAAFESHLASLPNDQARHDWLTEQLLSL